MRTVFVVEDDESIREIVLYALRSAGFEAEGFETGSKACAAMEKSLPSLVLLDIMMPGDDGLTILRRLRSTSRTKTLPVILLTAKGSEFDKVKGLDMGADDYLAKPFGVMELISRINAVLRRSAGDSAQESPVSVGCLTLDNARREVHAAGEKVTLTYKEYELLYCLALNAGLALRREQLMDLVWGYDVDIESRTLDMHIRSLRQKLGAAGSLIQTVRNIGYKLGEGT